MDRIIRDADLQTVDSIGVRGIKADDRPAAELPLASVGVPRNLAALICDTASGQVVI